MAAIEDLSFYCVDNRPAQLIEQFLDLCAKARPPIRKIALAIDAREEEFLRGVPTVVEDLRAHFRSVVGQPITPRQNFFEAGASSLQLVQLHVHLRQAGFAEITVTDLFAHATPHALAAHLGRRPHTGSESPHRPEPERRTLLDQRRSRAERRKGGAS